MSKPIDTQEFWKKRIDTAVLPFHSVYATTQEDWKEIERIHFGILEKNIKRTTNSVLDAGCGYGRLTDYFTNYTGVDLSEDFIELAKANNSFGTFIQADLRELPFGDQSFDWAICSSIRTMVIDNMGQDEWNKMHKELKRVADKIMILEYTNPGRYEIL